MPRIYKISRTGLKLIYKIRHHRGHGIHSPFVFDFINHVVEEKCPYYAYNDIKDYINGFPEYKFRPGKFNRFSFRIINYFGAKRIIEIGSGSGLNTLYLTASSTSTECISIETDISKRNLATKLYKGWNRNIQSAPVLDSGQINTQYAEKKVDGIFIDLKRVKEINVIKFVNQASILHDKTFIVINNIRSSRESIRIWKAMSDIEGSTAKLDLFNIGIIFFNKNLYRWTYKISY